MLNYRLRRPNTVKTPKESTHLKPGSSKTSSSQPTSSSAGVVKHAGESSSFSCAPSFVDFIVNLKHTQIPRIGSGGNFKKPAPRRKRPVKRRREDSWLVVSFINEHSVSVEHYFHSMEMLFESYRFCKQSIWSDATAVDDDVFVHTSWGVKSHWDEGERSGKRLREGSTFSCTSGTIFTKNPATFITSQCTTSQQVLRHNVVHAIALRHEMSALRH